MSIRKDKKEELKYSNTRYINALVAMAELFNAFEDFAENLYSDDIMITSVRVKLPDWSSDSYLVVIRADQEGRGVVAFHGAESFSGVLMGLLQRMKNKSLKWKEDMYANNTQGEGKSTAGES